MMKPQPVHIAMKLASLAVVGSKSLEKLFVGWAWWHMSFNPSIPEADCPHGEFQASQEQNKKYKLLV